MANLWSGRFAGEPGREVFEFGRSFPFDRRLFEDDVRGSLAWVEAISAVGAIDAADARAIADGLLAILRDGRQDPAYVDGPDEDVHAFVERKLVERIGEAGKRLHTGRSRNEQVSVDLRLYLKRRIPALQGAVAELVAALADQAALAGDTPMPAYTHLRRAQPVLVAHFWLAHVAALRRDYAYLDVAAGAADCLPLGSGAVAGTSYLLDVQALAARLGFSSVAANSIDASSDRDFVSVFLHACSLAMVHLSRMAEDLVIFTGEEFRFFELSDDVATGSSLMPQKKNPDPLEDWRLAGPDGRRGATMSDRPAAINGKRNQAWGTLHACPACGQCLCFGCHPTGPCVDDAAHADGVAVGSHPASAFTATGFARHGICLRRGRLTGRARQRRVPTIGTAISAV